jgi:hypothetical protein
MGECLGGYGVMGVYGGPTETFIDNFTSRWYGSTSVSGGVVIDGLILALDASVSRSYPGSGNTWFDLSGNSNDGTLTNSPVYDSANGGIFILDGTSEYIQFPTSVSASLNGISSASLSIWVRLNSGSNGAGNSGIIQLSGHTNSNGNLYYYTDASRVGGIWLDVFRTDRVFTGDWQPTFSGTDWHNLTVTATAGTNGWKMYLNGILRFQTTGQSQISVSSSNFGGVRLGQNSNSRHIRGRFGSIQIYNRALTASEIQQNFIATRSRFGI